jgi:hypothetical protein
LNYFSGIEPGVQLFQAFRLSGFQAFRLSGFQAFRLSGFQAFEVRKVSTA